MLSETSASCHTKIVGGQITPMSKLVWGIPTVVGRWIKLEWK